MNQRVLMFDPMASSGDGAGGLSFISKVALCVAALLVLGNYYYMYFTGVNPQDGAMESGGVFRYVKVLALLVFFTAILEPRVKIRLCFAELLLGAFFIASLVYFLAAWDSWDSGGLLYFNMVICALPLLIFPLTPDFEKIRYFFDTSAVILIVQIGIDVLVYLSGGSIWANKAFIGGLGNPSSFGVLCNMFVAYILFYRGLSPGWLVALCVLSAGILMTSSLLSIFLLGLIFAIWAWSRGAHYLLLSVLLGAVVIMSVGERLLSDHLMYKVSSFFDLFGRGLSDSSASVYYRSELYGLFVEHLSANFFGVLLYGYPDTYYYSVDSQYLAYIASFGAFVAFVFFLAVGLTALAAYRRRDKYGVFCAVVIAIFMVVFFSNRILDYYPIPLFFFLLIASARHAETPVASSRIAHV